MVETKRSHTLGSDFHLDLDCQHVLYLLRPAECAISRLLFVLSLTGLLHQEMGASASGNERSAGGPCGRILHMLV